MLIDSHCHFFELDDWFELLDSIQKYEIDKITAICDNKNEIRRANKYDFLDSAWGIHPLKVSKSRESILRKRIDDYELLFDDLDVIGEIGLDFRKGKREKQISIFKKFLNLAEKYKKPISAHSYKSVDEVLEILDTFSLTSVSMHWFTGSIEELRILMSRGYYVGITPNIEENRFDYLIENLELDHILSESDGPYTGYSPKDISLIIKRISDFKDIGKDEVSSNIRHNYKKFLNKTK